MLYCTFFQYEEAKRAKFSNFVLHLCVLLLIKFINHKLGAWASKQKNENDY